MHGKWEDRRTIRGGDGMRERQAGFGRTLLFLRCTRWGPFHPLDEPRLSSRSGIDEGPDAGKYARGGSRRCRSSCEGAKVRRSSALKVVRLVLSVLSVTCLEMCLVRKCRGTATYSTVLVPYGASLRHELRPSQYLLFFSLSLSCCPVGKAGLAGSASLVRLCNAVRYLTRWSWSCSLHRQQPS